MWQDLLLIMALQLVYVPIYTVGTVLMVKGYNHQASLLSIGEVLIYVYGLSIVLQGDQTFIAMLVYAVSNAIGLEIGLYIEGKIALGYLTVEIHTKEKDERLERKLKELNYKTSIYNSKDKTSFVIEVITDRSKETKLEETIREYQPYADLIMYEPYDIKKGRPKSVLRRRWRV